MKSILAWIGLLIMTGGRLGAGELSLLGTHPTSSLTSFPSIFALKAHEGRIYMGYGDWGVYPVAVVVSYDPVSNAFRLEYSAPTDALDNFQSIGGRLYAPSIDPIHYEGFQDYSMREGGRWRSYTPGGLLHAFEIDTINGVDLWMAAAKSFSETPTLGGVVMRSVDGGRSWLDVTLTASQTRYYYGFVLRGRYYVKDRIFNGTAVTTISSPHELFYRATVIASGTNEFVVGLAGRGPGIDYSSPFPLVTFDGNSWRTIHSSVLNFTVHGGSIYALSGGQIIKSGFLSASQTVWESLPLTSPTNSRSIEVQGGIVYIGNATGQLWAGRVDGTPLSITPAININEMTDAFGRALAYSGNTVAVGAPDFSGSNYLCGQVVTWERTEAGWTPGDVIQSPIPSFSGWFGRDVALDNDVLVVLESGKDASRTSRGSSAAVHLYQRLGQGWQWRQTLSHPFAHSVALEGQRLAVATETALYIYTLTNGNPAEAGLETTLTHQAPGYEPIGRVALDGDTLAYGLVGDLSRSGGPGQVDVYERSAIGSWIQVATLRQDSPPLPGSLQQHPDAFGFAVSLKDGWLAVGAPRNDVAAAQAGAVHLYERTNSASGITYILRQTIISPVAQPEARFGSALSMAGARLLVGSPGVDGLRPQLGRVFAYERSGAIWESIGEMTAPADTDGEFGWEVLAATNLWMASGRSTRQLNNLEDRVSIMPNPSTLTAVDLVVSQAVSESVITNGSSLAYSITLTNLGPSTATQVRLACNVDGGFEVNSVVGTGVSCTNLGSEVRCTVADLPPGNGGGVKIFGRVLLSGECGIVQSEAVASARELETNTTNNRASIAAFTEPPSITLLSPADGTKIPFRGTVSMSASYSGTSTIASVSFYADEVLLTSLFSPPYQYQWTNAPSGEHRITARVVGPCGIAGKSEVQRVVVATNLLPLVSVLSPVSGTRFPNANSIPIYITATDPDGTVTRVDLYRSSTPFRQIQGPPFFFAWSNPPPGSHSMFAIASDNHGGVSISKTVRLTIGPEPIDGTNWVAYNDHSPGADTLSTTTRWDVLGASPGASGALRNTITGVHLPVTLSITRSPTTFSGNAGLAPNAGTPAAAIFSGQVDFVAGVAANISLNAVGWVRYSFAGLDPNLRYTLNGTAVRGLPEYTNRWTLVELSGARSFEPSHTDGCLTGLGSMNSNQVALNTGFNLAGDIVTWSNIQPAPDGTFAIACSQYFGPVPGGSSDGEGAFALTAISLGEMAVPVGPAPSFITQPVSITISPGASAAFAVSATGDGPLSYQWLRNRTVLPGANSESLVFNQASTNDAGAYAVIVTGATGGAVSDAAALTFLSLRMESQAGKKLTRLNLVGPVGQRYGVQLLDALEPLPTWNILTNLTLLNNQVSIIDPSSNEQSNRFYRALPLPQ